MVLRFDKTWSNTEGTLIMLSAPDQASENFIQPKVSVIIPIYNGASDLSALGDCLLRQSYPRDRVEYLLIDNNSQDNTSEYLQQLAATAASKGIQLRPLAEMQIQSSYAARNRGIRLSKGDILAFTDADCRPLPNWLENLVLPFQDPKVGIVIGEIAALPGNSFLESYAEYRQMMTQRYTIAHPFYPYGQTANLAVRKTALTKAGLFRPHLTTGGDADLCWRIQMADDWQVVFAEEAIIQHRHRATFSELSSQWQRYGRSNRYLHDLHGVALSSPLSSRTVRDRLGRWLVKDLPKATWQFLRGQAPPVALVSIPLDLYCTRSRTIGQREAQLPEAAREIVWLTDESPSEKQPISPEKSATRNL